MRDEPLEWIRKHIHANYGIYFPEKKLYSLENKLQRRYRKLGLESLDSYARYLAEDSDEIPYFLDAVTTNKTYFFREEPHWNFLVDRLHSDWARERNELRLWSAACSSGEEAYTAAMLLHEDMAGIGYRVLATDVSEKIIRVGARGIYPASALDPVRDYNPKYVKNYFDRHQADTYRITESLRQNVYFRQFNLKFQTNPFEGTFDLILLRNVLIYFDASMIQSVINHCEELLRHGGFLVIGQTENINEVDHQLEKVQPSIYRKT